MTVAANELLARLTEIRATDPGAVYKALAKRKRRPLLISPPPLSGAGQGAGTLFLVAADHPARGVLKAGSDPKVLYDVITNSAGNSWMFQNRVPHILAGDYAPRSAVNIFVKDLGIVLEAGKKSTLPLPLTAAAHQMFLMAAAAGHGREDDAAVIKIFPGVDLPRS